jgi:nucleoside triphosphatase
MADKTFPRGIELVSGVVVENNDGEILMARSPKWNGKWVMPGGHVEPGEKLVEAAVREGEEETGLKLRPIALFDWGELINPKDFHRPAHFVYFNTYCKIEGGSVHLQKEELKEYKWIAPERALKLDLAESYPQTIRDFLEYVRSHR